MKTADIEYQCPGCGAAIPAGTKVCPNCGANYKEPASNTEELSAADKEAIQNLTAVVVKELKKGSDHASISQKLTEMGMDQKDAAQFVENIHDQAAKLAEQEQITIESYTPALLGAGLAAIVGGVLWGLIVIFSNYEMGIMAWGMGVLAGYAVVKFSKGKKGVPFQIIAVLSSLMGILIGKYISFYHFLNQAIAEQAAGNPPADISIFSAKVMKIFIAEFSSIVSGYDLLWVILAVITAWRIPKGLGLKYRT
jgi:uncharacterized Zn finger protein (UPF0148 family)